ncbi:MAG: hypothetical protein ACYSUC_02395, partial [Planctomycetota bacterium]
MSERPTVFILPKNTARGRFLLVAVSRWVTFCPVFLLNRPQLFADKAFRIRASGKRVEEGERKWEYRAGRMTLFSVTC